MQLAEPLMFSKFPFCNTKTMMYFRYFLLFWCFFAFSCGTIAIITKDPARSYVIDSGKHLSRPYLNPSKIVGGTINARIFVDSPCNVYVADNPEQVNKIVGISTRPVVKNDNSAILGWSTRPDNTMDFWFFVNYGDRFEQKHLGIGEAGKWYELLMWATEKHWHIAFADTAYRMPRTPSNDKLWLVEPYFGGKSPNPSDVKCTIRIEFL